MIKAQQRATSVQGGDSSFESHMSLHTLSAGDLKIYSSTYPILRCSHHVNCKMMRQRIAPVAFSPSSFYINHLETAHPLSVTWGTHTICDKTCSFSFFLFNQTLYQHISTDWCWGYISCSCLRFHKYRSLCAVWISADMSYNVTTLLNKQL